MIRSIVSWSLIEFDILRYRPIFSSRSTHFSHIAQPPLSGEGNQSPVIVLRAAGLFCFIGGLERFKQIGPEPSYEEQSGPRRILTPALAVLPPDLPGHNW